MPEKHVQVDLFIKEPFKQTDFWKKGVIFINDRVPNQRTEIFNLDDARIERNYQYKLRTGELKEDVILDEERGSKTTQHTQHIEQGKIKFKFSDFGENIIRNALDKFEFYKFETLKDIFPILNPVREFILSSNYLGGVEIEVLDQKIS